MHYCVENRKANSDTLLSRNWDNSSQDIVMENKDNSYKLWVGNQKTLPTSYENKMQKFLRVIE
jgi:hypothetical protein